MKFVYDLPMTTFFETEGGILQEHWEKLAGNKENIKLNPDIQKYQSLQDLGILKNIMAYEGEEIVGYSIFLLQPHIHYKENIFGYVDVIFVKEKNRINPFIGIKLIVETEKVCKANNVSTLLYHTKPHHDVIEKILTKKGYKHIENTFGKYLKE